MIISQETIDILKTGGVCFGLFLVWFWCVLMFKVGSLGCGDEIGMIGMFIVPVVVLISIGYAIFTSTPVVITLNHLLFSVPPLILIVINFFIIHVDDRQTTVS